MRSIHTCDDLGVCNGRHCHDVSACPDFDLIACNSGPCDGADNAPCPHDVSRCEVPCSPEPADGELYPWPRYPFAPGVIDGFQPPKDNAWLHSAPAVVALVLLLALLGSLVGCSLGEFVVWPAWLIMGLPG